MSDHHPRRADPLRLADLVPLRRMLGSDSIVLRVNPDGSCEPFARMPMLFFERAIRKLLSDEHKQAFEQVCADTIADGTPHAVRLEGADSSDEVLVHPILADDSDDCRFLVCWVRDRRGPHADIAGAQWHDLRLDDVSVRYRVRHQDNGQTVEAAPCWLLPTGEVLELWPHHGHVSATGLGHAVMETLIYDTAEAAASYPHGPNVRIEVPSADLLAGLVPVFHGAARAAGLAPERVVVAVPVELAVDADLLPVIVHLRTMGLRIDIVGLDSLTTTLHTVSDTSTHVHRPARNLDVRVGEWAGSYAEAIGRPD